MFPKKTGRTGLPFLPADMAWFTAARNWSCRSSSDPTALGCGEDGAAGEWKHQEAPAKNQQDFRRVFIAGFEGTPLTK